MKTASTPIKEAFNIFLIVHYLCLDCFLILSLVISFRQNVSTAVGSLGQLEPYLVGESEFRTLPERILFRVIAEVCFTITETEKAGGGWNLLQKRLVTKHRWRRPWLCTDLFCVPGYHFLGLTISIRIRIKKQTYARTKKGGGNTKSIRQNANCTPLQPPILALFFEDKKNWETPSPLTE